MTEHVELLELRPQKAVTIRRTVPDSGLGAFFGEVLPEAVRRVERSGRETLGPMVRALLQQRPPRLRR